MKVSEIKAAETEYLIYKLAWLYTCKFARRRKWVLVDEERIIKELSIRLNLSQEELTKLFNS